MRFTHIVLVIALLGAAFACVDTNLTALGNSTLNLSAGQCYNLTDVNLTLQVDAPVSINLTLGPNSTSNSTSGPWGNFSASGNLTVLNNTTVVNSSVCSLNLIPSALNQSFVNSSCNVSISAVPVFNISVDPYTTSQNFGNLFCNMTVHAIPPVSSVLLVNSTSPTASYLGGYWNFTAVYLNSSPAVCPNASLTVVENITNVSGCSLNLTPSTVSQSVVNSTCNVYLAPISPTYCWENRTETAANLTVWRDSCNNVFTCAPTAAAPTVCPVPVCNVSATASQPAAAAPANTTISPEQWDQCTIFKVPYNVSNDTKNYVDLAIPLTDVGTYEESQAILHQNASTYSALKNQECEQRVQAWMGQFTALNQTVYGPNGMNNTLSGFITGEERNKSFASIIATLVIVGLAVFYVIKSRRPGGALALSRVHSPEETEAIKKKLDEAMYGPEGKSR